VKPIATDFFKEHFNLPAVETKTWVCHADLDSFYASVEIKLRPELQGKPVIVGPNPNLGVKRGVVLTCSYEARKFGVRSAMPIMQAHKLCPDAEYSFSGFEAYRNESNAVMEIFRKYDPDLTRVSIDEAYLDISDKINIATYESEQLKEKKIKQICLEIQNKVWNEASLPVSIGASHTRPIAKIASQIAKPHGILVIPHHKFRNILDPLPLKIISGVGKKSFTRLKEKGYIKIGDIANLEYSALPSKHVQWIWLTVNGIQVNSSLKRRSNRSHSKERTFRDDIEDTLIIRQTLRKLLDSLLNDLSNEFRTITVKLRDENFRTITRSFSFEFYINPKNSDHQRSCIKKANELLNDLFSELKHRKFRLLGIKASNFKTSSKKVQKSVKDFL
jgi:DNA polymerase IV (DinB-like DNA polymerase)